MLTLQIRQNHIHNFLGFVASLPHADASLTGSPNSFLALQRPLTSDSLTGVLLARYHSGVVEGGQEEVEGVSDDTVCPSGEVAGCRPGEQCT